MSDLSPQNWIVFGESFPREDPGLLVIDDNANGRVDGAVELFGSATQDGFAVLETLDGNRDGVIDAQDAAFAKLRVWRDLNRNGALDEGELQTLAQAGIAAISLARTDLPGTNQGHTVGYGSTFTRTDGSTGAAQTIYFQTDRQDTQDNTPPFTPAEGVDALPLLPGSGNIHSIAYALTFDAAFRAAWTQLTDEAAGLDPSVLHARFEALLLRWAGVDGVNPYSRGELVDARHLAFVEAFFGDSYREIVRGEEARTYPSRASTAGAVEASFQQIVSVLETLFLAQTARSLLVRGGDIGGALESPFFFYALLQFSDAEGNPAPASPENVQMVVSLIAQFAPTAPGAATSYLTKALLGLEGMVSIAFDGDRSAYAEAAGPGLDSIADPVLHRIAEQIVDGRARLGSTAAEGIRGTSGDDVFIAGGGGDFIDGREGSDIVVYNKRDGNLWIRDDEGSAAERDKLVLTDLNASEVDLTRVGDNLLIKVIATGKTITVEDFFWHYADKAYGTDSIRFRDGTEWDRAAIQEHAVYRGDSGRNTIIDSALDDVVRGGRGDDFVKIGQGSDTVIYGRGDGSDVIDHSSSSSTERDQLILADLNPDDVVFSRVGDDILITIKETGEFIRDQKFFFNSSTVTGWRQYSYGFESVQFADGTVWERDRIQSAAWLRGDANANTLSGSGLSETFVGGQGDDVMVGSHGSDTYFWKTGDGDDRIGDFSNNATDTDTLVLQDVQSDEVSLAYQGGNVLLTIEATGEVLQLDDLVLGVDNLVTDWNQYRYGIDVIKFADGVTWDRQRIYQQIGADFIGKKTYYRYVFVETVLVNAYWYDEFGHIGDISEVFENGPNDRFNGGSGNDVMNGTVGHDVLSGYGGNDIIAGYGGHDVLYGHDGSDTIFGGDGYDFLRGDEHNDFLDGGDGSDRLDGGNGDDELRGGDGKDYLSGSYGNDTIIGGRGDDVIASFDNGGTATGSDTFVYALGDGNDSILDETFADHHAGQSDILLLGDLNALDLRFSHSGADLLIHVSSTGETIRIVDQFHQMPNAAGRGLELIRFANGEEWNRQRINQEAWYRGTAGKDTIGSSSSDDNTISGGLGDDYIVSDRGGGFETGSDTFLYARGDGNDVIVDTTQSALGLNENDTLLLSDLDASDLEFSRSGADLLISVLNTGETIRIVDQFSEAWNAAGRGIEVIRFADGEEWARQRIYQEAWYRGTDGRDIIISNGVGDNTFLGGLGNDTITSGSGAGSATGSDTYIYARGDGNDVIGDTTQSLYHANESDLLLLRNLNRTDLQFLRSGNDLLINIPSTGQAVRVVDQFSESANAPGRGIEVIRFADGDEWSRQTIYGAATAGSGFIVGSRFLNDPLIGGDGQQNIYGEAGDDTLDGRAGSDLLYGGLGNDILLISQSAAGEIDTLDGGAGIDTVSFASFSAAVWVDLVTTGSEARTRDRADLGAGTWRGIAEISTVENITGTAFADQLFGDAGANVLIGNAGADALDGRSGNDTLNGGAGNDSLTGGLNSDTFVFDVDFGVDVITDFKAGANTDDVIQFSTAVFSDYAAVLAASSQSGSNVVITAGTGNTITLKDVQRANLHADDFQFA
ncbi:calcium-binding protein [Microvirga sp. TS319]|uniref:calcium-binding protein n=1 Tax=Microvirga sp. TS319 TaxID=3241165 RepID=UPI00351A3A53